MLDLIRKLWGAGRQQEAERLRPTGLSRRDFLRAVGVTSTTVAIGGVGGLILPDKSIVDSTGQAYDPIAKQEPYMLEFFAYQTVGAIGVPGSGVRGWKVDVRTVPAESGSRPDFKTVADKAFAATHLPYRFHQFALGDDGSLKRQTYTIYPEGADGGKTEEAG